MEYKVELFRSGKWVTWFRSCDEQAAKRMLAMCEGYYPLQSWRLTEPAFPTGWNGVWLALTPLATLALVTWLSRLWG